MNRFIELRKSVVGLGLITVVVLSLCWWTERNWRLGLADNNELLAETVRRLKAQSPVPKTDLLPALPETNAAFSELLKLRGVVSILRREIEDVKSGLNNSTQIVSATESPIARLKVAYAEELLNRATHQFQSGSLSEDEFLEVESNRRLADAAQRNDRTSILAINLERAEASLAVGEAKHKVGAVSGYEIRRLRFQRDLANAELQGNHLEVARLRFEMYDQELNVMRKKQAAGVVGEEEVLKVQLNRDIADVEYKAIGEKKY